MPLRIVVFGGICKEYIIYTINYFVADPMVFMGFCCFNTGLDSWTE